MASERVKRMRFENRKSSLLKKGWELSTLCDVNVCLIVVSPDGKLDTWPENLTDVEKVLDSLQQPAREEERGGRKRKRDDNDVVDDESRVPCFHGDDGFLIENMEYSFYDHGLGAMQLFDDDDEAEPSSCFSNGFDSVIEIDPMMLQQGSTEFDVFDFPALPLIPQPLLSFEGFADFYYY